MRNYCRREKWYRKRDEGSRGYAVEIAAFRVQFLESRRPREARQLDASRQAEQAEFDWGLEEQ